MSKAFVYTEIQVSIPFAEAPWREINQTLAGYPGLRNKTWLAGAGNGSVGGFYEFDSVETARGFVIGWFPEEARRLGAPQTTRVFDGEVVEEASRDMGSAHFGIRPTRKPGAFVYTEVQASIPFANVPWRVRNPGLRAQPGLISKTWLSGVGTQAPGGLYAFESVETARRFATHAFPAAAADMNAAFTARVFDAAATEPASRPLASPFYV